MYYEDLVETAVEPDAYSDSNSAAVTNKKTVSLLPNRPEPNYEKYKILINGVWRGDGRYYKSIITENYGSGQQGTKIRNAVTGERYPYLVGSLNEELFFKVSDASGRNKRKSTLTLFYDSPEQYENHHFTTVDPAIKKKWNEKHQIARRRILVD